MRILLPLLALVVAAPAAAQHDHHPTNDDATSRHRFDDAESWAERFDDPARDEWQKPDRVVATLVDRDDLVVADVGSGTGYFSVRFASALPAGLVIGADIEPDMVRYLNDRARTEGFSNLVSVLAAPDDPHLPAMADLVFLCNTYHHIDDRIDYFRRLEDQLTPGGRVAIVDYRPGSTKGPPHKLPADDVKTEMAAAGYELVAEHDDLPEQYLLVFAQID